MARNGDFDDEEGFFESIMRQRGQVPMPPSMLKMLTFLAAVIVLSVVGIVTWKVWPGHHAGDGTDVPLVRADSTDYKVKPDDAGGMVIPNKDSTVFETIESEKSDGKAVENLLEDDETPMKKEQVFPEEKPVEKSVEPSVEKSDVKSDKTEVKPEPASKKDETPKPSIIDTLKEEAGTKSPEPEKKTSPVVAEKPAAKGSVYIQLAAVKSDSEAKAKWTKLQAQYPALKGLSLRVTKADLGAKGVFYRVQAGGMSADAATQTCAKVKASGGGCMIVK